MKWYYWLAGGVLAGDVAAVAHTDLAAALWFVGFLALAFCAGRNW